MPTKLFTSGRIRKADDDSAWRQRAALGRPVGAGVQAGSRGSLPAPVQRAEPGDLLGDRVPQEDPKGRPMRSSAEPDGAKKLGDLFGGGAT
jgi:hypothetical protein